MTVVDLTGVIADGLWTCGSPFPDYHLRPLPQPEWVKDRVWCEIFEGMHSQTGTYLETPAHFLGYEKSYPLSDVPLEKLVDCRAVVLQVRPGLGGRQPVTAEMLETAADGMTADDFRGTALLVSTGAGALWSDPGYLDNSPYFTRDAMDWLIARKPFILGGDLPRWENLEKPQGFFPSFYAADILMLAPLVRLERCPKQGLLTVLPLNIASTCCCPCRAIMKY